MSITTDLLHYWSTRTGLDADIASSLHKVRGADISRLILSVSIQKKASEVLHRVVNLTRDLLVREQEWAIRSSTARIVRYIEQRITSYR